MTVEVAEVGVVDEGTEDAAARYFSAALIASSCRISPSAAAVLPPPSLLIPVGLYTTFDWSALQPLTGFRAPSKPLTETFLRSDPFHLKFSKIAHSSVAHSSTWREQSLTLNFGQCKRFECGLSPRPLRPLQPRGVQGCPPTTSEIHSKAQTCDNCNLWHAFAARRPGHNQYSVFGRQACSFSVLLTSHASRRSACHLRGVSDLLYYTCS